MAVARWRRWEYTLGQAACTCASLFTKLNVAVSPRRGALWCYGIVIAALEQHLLLERDVYLLGYSMTPFGDCDDPSIDVFMGLLS